MAGFRFQLLVICLSVMMGMRADEQAKLIARPDAFPTLVNPNCSHCLDEAKRRGSELKLEDPVLAWTRGYSDGGAIPIRFFLNTYRVISDSYGVFVFDPDAGYARGYEPSYHFVFHGWRNGVMVMKDQSDGTLFSCLSGLGIDGPRKGQSLRSIPTITTTWGDVMKRNPHAVAYRMVDKYQPREIPTIAHPDSLASRTKPDPRLPTNTMVLGVRIGNQAIAFPVQNLAAVTQVTLAGEPIVILKQNGTAAAYKPMAHQPRQYLAPRPDKSGISPPNPGIPIPNGIELPSKSIDDFKAFDIAGRGVQGDLAGWTLEPVEYVQCQWFAWAAEFPRTEVASDDKPTDKRISGTSEFLRVLPKPFGVIQAVDIKTQTVTLLLDGEKIAKPWPVEPDAELRVHGWWGRLEQFQPGQRVWLWLKLNRKSEPVSIAMMADALSEWEMHASLAKNATVQFQWEHVEKQRTQQRRWLRQQWTQQGLPGTLTFHHLFSGELELMMDHESMRWARSLKAGDAVTLLADPPIKAVVRSVAPWRERTRLRLVVGELASADLHVGQRLHLHMAPLPMDVDDSPYPPDIDRPRSRDERAEWFMCNIYCVCSVGNDTCTGMFYTLASCNPNSCGAPQSTRRIIFSLIDSGKTDRDIWDQLVKERGPLLLRPHLRP